MSSAAAVPLARITPTRCGKYTLVAKLGHGGMAEVFLAVASGMAGFRKLLVVKRIHPQLLEDPEFVNMFLDEARLAARLNHPNVVQTHEVGESDGLPFIAMEYLEGQALDRILKYAGRREKPPSPGVVGRIVADALAGLHYAHTLRDFNGSPLGVVHRDVSPSNVFVTYQGSTKILDFGVAKATMKLQHTRTGRVKGKFTYMAPEQARAEDVDARADVWSMGVVLWEALTGQRLFKSDSEAQTLELLLKGDMKELVDRDAKNMSDAFRNVVLRALERDRDGRFASAAEMGAAVEAAMASEQMHIDSVVVASYLASLFSDVIAGQQETIGRIASRMDSDSVEVPTDPDSLLTPSSGSAGARGYDRRTPRRRAPLIGRATLFIGAAVIMAATALAVALRPPDAAPRGARDPVEVEPTDRGDTPPDLDPRRRISATSTSSAVVAPTTQPAVADTPPDTSIATTQARRSHRRGQRGSRATAQHRTQPTASAPPQTDPPPEQAVAEPGFLTLDTRPWSEVFLGGRSLGTTPLVRERLPAGTHTLMLRNVEQSISMEYSVTVRAGEVTTRRLGLR